MDIAAIEADLRAKLAVQPDDAMLHARLGSALYGAGRVEEAIDAYDEAIRLDPKSILFLRQRALAYHALGALDKAVLDIIDAVTLAPRDAALADTLGVFLQDLNRLDEAKLCHAQAIDEDPGNATYYLNLAVAMVKSGVVDAARELYGAVLGMNPTEPEAYISLAELASRSADHRKAIEILESGVAAGVVAPAVFANLGNAYFAINEREKAAAVYALGLEHAPGDGYMTHMLAIAQGAPSEKASPEYVAHVFDGYARHFEAHLVRGLSYRVPGLVRNELIRARPDCDPARPGAAKLDILDIGCGTGLVGVMTYDLAGYLKGIDLSSKMIAEARSKNIYHDLAVGEMVKVMGREPARYDAVLAADVFIYLGDLAPVLAAAKGCLKPGGSLIFSVERVPGSAYALQPTGRFAHSGDYLVRAMTEAGLSVVALRSEVIRSDNKSQVQGYVAVARRPAA